MLCWEVFSVGKTPYPGLDPVGVVELLDTGGRLHCPHNEACSQEMYENCILNNNYSYRKFLLHPAGILEWMNGPCIFLPF